MYKQNQGKLVRGLTFLAVFAIVAVGAWQLYGWDGFWKLFSDSVPFLVRGLVAGGIAVVGTWIAFRLVNLPSFADFLVSVEAEMIKVSWPSKSELYSSTIVVLVLVAILTTVLFTYDIVWQQLFKFIGIL